MIYSDRINALVIYTKAYQFIKISLNFDEQYFEKHFDKFESNLDLNIQRTFL